MKNYFSFVVIFSVVFTVCRAQTFAPQAGKQGSTAIHQDSSIIVAWATGCEVVRGLIRITEPGSFVSFGKPSNAVGPRTGETTFNVVSLGDGGSATLTFQHFITNGNGPDFAVFENGFIINGPEPRKAFLELAFVEVSSDGEHFVRFPAVNEYTTPQLGGFDGMDARYLHNLAGKYIAGYGVPFDLDDVKDSANINVDSITHVRVVDVVGNIDPQYATYDSHGNPVNDPWPTPFHTGGFDLGGVAVINQRFNPNASDNFQQSKLKPSIHVFPNPTRDVITIQSERDAAFYVCNIIGEVVARGTLSLGKNTVSIAYLTPGFYFVGTQHSAEVVKLQVE